MSAAQQAFHRRYHHADHSVGDEAVVNPVPGEADHQENVARAQDFAHAAGVQGGNGAPGRNDSHGAL